MRHAKTIRYVPLSGWLLGLCSLLLVQTVWGQALFLPPSSYGNAELSIPETTSFYENVFQDAPAYEAILDFPADSSLWQAARPIGRLDILLQHRDGRRLATYCTASLISANLIMTAHHCVPGIDPNFRVVQAELRMDYLARSLQGESFPVDINTLETSIDYDYSILRVEGNPGDKYGTISLRTHVPEPREPLFLIHHPQGSPKQITRTRCLLHNSNDAISTSELRHRCDSQGGSSGGLLFSLRDQQVLGMHWGGYDPSLPDPERYNVAKRLNVLIAQSAILQRLLQLAGGAIQQANPANNTNDDVNTAPNAITTSGTVAGTDTNADSNTGTSESSSQQNSNKDVGFLQLSSSPQGAEVYLGSRLLGVTPIEGLSLPAGVYVLRLAKAGYDIREANLTIAANKLSKGTVPLLLQGQGRILRPYGEASQPRIMPDNPDNNPDTNAAASNAANTASSTPNTPNTPNTTTVTPLPIIPSHLDNNTATTNQQQSNTSAALQNPFRLLSPQQNNNAGNTDTGYTANQPTPTPSTTRATPDDNATTDATNTINTASTTQDTHNTQGTQTTQANPDETHSETQANWEIIAQGSQSSLLGAARSFTIENETQLFNLWGQAYAGALRLPALPQIDFSSQRVMAIFAGAQPRGNRFVVERISLEPSTHINMRLVAPEATAQYGGSPWIFIRLPKDNVANAAVTINNQVINIFR